MKYPFFNSEVEKSMQVEKDKINKIVDLAKSLDWVFCKIEKFLTEEYTPKQLSDVRRHMLTDKLMNDKYKRVQYQFKKFIMNTASTRL